MQITISLEPIARTAAGVIQIGGFGGGPSYREPHRLWRGRVRNRFTGDSFVVNYCT
jgi:hypothetical protein